MFSLWYGHLTKSSKTVLQSVLLHAKQQPILQGARGSNLVEIAVVAEFDDSTTPPCPFGPWLGFWKVQQNRGNRVNCQPKKGQLNSRSWEGCMLFCRQRFSTQPEMPRWVSTTRFGCERYKPPGLGLLLRAVWVVRHKSTHNSL